ncbi:hypothetical protein ABFA07_018620 [Porites harrisoni]
MEDLDVDLFKLLVTVGFVFLTWTKALWEDLQNASAAFYPDGLDKCPPDTYTIDDNKIRVRCIECPTCPAGQEPSPPCGSTLVRKAVGDCVPCKAGTYSDKADSITCKVCTDCGSKEILSSCTIETNARCRECPYMQYDDETSNTCKPCSLCCEENSVAQKNCLTSRICPGNCFQLTPIQEKYHSFKLQKLVAITMRTPWNKTSVLKLTRRNRVKQKVNKKIESTVKANIEQPTHSERTEREIHQENYDDTYTPSETKYARSNSALDKDIDGKTLQVLQSMQSPTNVLEGGKAKIDTPSPEILKPRGVVNGEKEQLVVTTFKPRVPPPEAPNSDIGKSVPLTPENQRAIKTFNNDTAVKNKRRIPAIVPPSVTPSTAQNAWAIPPPTPNNIPPMSKAVIEQSVVPSAASFLSSFSGTIAGLVVFGLIALIIYVVGKGCVRRKQKGYRKLSEKDEPEEPQIRDDQSYEDSKERGSLTHEVTIKQMGQNEAIQIGDDLNLCEIPPDLEDILVKRLDVLHSRSSNNEYGWVKVGNAAGISGHELKFYKTEYLRPNGSPTKLLLEKLGSQGKTISYLIDVLQAPELQLDNVAASIRRRVTRV